MRLNLINIIEVSNPLLFDGSCCEVTLEFIKKLASRLS